MKDFAGRMFDFSGQSNLGWVSKATFVCDYVWSVHMRPYRERYARSFPGTFAATLIFTHFIALYDQKLKNRLGFVLPNLVVQPCPLMSDERSWTNELPDTADDFSLQLSNSIYR